MKTYTTLEVATKLNVNIYTLKNRVKTMNLRVRKYQNRNYFSEKQFNLIKKCFKISPVNKVIVKTPEIIYVTRTIHHFESKSNFWSENKINEIMLQL